jgi:hypothetical protein
VRTQWIGLAAALVAGILTGVVRAQDREAVINEFMAVNAGTLADDDGDFSDWIEVSNRRANPLSLEGWFLTDRADDLTRWRFPAVSLPADGHLIIFASGKDRATLQGTHTNFRLAGDGEYLALVKPDGRTIAHDFAPSYPPQSADVSYGLAAGGEAPAFLAIPTPGAPNAPFVHPPRFVPGAGLVFTESLELRLTTESGAAIRYTLDRSEPTETSALYTKPIELTSTAIVRAAVFEPSGARSLTVTAGYVFASPDVGDFDSNLPIVIVDSREPIGEDQQTAAFVSVIAVRDGRAAITDPPSFSGAGGIKVRGASSVHLSKKQFALEIQDENDEDVEVPLLDLPPESDWVLHAPYEDKTLMRNHLAYMWFRRIGHYSVRTRFVEAFINTDSAPLAGSDYVGLYVLMEKIKRDRNRVDITKLEREDSEEPEVTGGYIFKHDRPDPGDTGFTTESGRRILYVEPKESEITPEQAAWVRSYFTALEDAVFGPDFADPLLGYSGFIDVDSTIDYNILVELTKNTDGQSTFMYKDRGGKLKMGPVWDYNRALGLSNQLRGWETHGWQLDLHLQHWPQWFEWLNRLFEDAAFRARWAERWLELRLDRFSTDAILRDVEEAAALLDEAQVRNFERWPGVLGRDVWVNYFVGRTYREEVDWLKDWLVARARWIDGQVLPTVSFSKNGGNVDVGFELTMTSDAGDIFYTLDGSDPRAEDGGPAGRAILYSGETIVIESNLVVGARVRLTDELWGGHVQPAFFVTTPKVTISEIMYDPLEGTPFEFVELYNFGDRPVALRGLQFTSGIFFEFGEGTLEPGAHVVVVRDPDAFASRYDTSAIFVAGKYRGFFNDRAELITLEGPLGEPIAEFSYSNSWYPETGGKGHSLVLADPAGWPPAWDDPAAWRASSELHGSPGREDPGTIAAAGAQLPGDGNQDGRRNIVDPIHLLESLLVGTTRLACADGSARAPGNVDLLDANGDGAVDLSDAISQLLFLFGRGLPPPQGVGCRLMLGCPAVCSGE